VLFYSAPLTTAFLRRDPLPPFVLVFALVDRFLVDCASVGGATQSSEVPTGGVHG
jgi:hypothetical protein